MRNILFFSVLILSSVSSIAMNYKLNSAEAQRASSSVKVLVYSTQSRNSYGDINSFNFEVDSNTKVKNLYERLESEFGYLGPIVIDGVEPITLGRLEKNDEKTLKDRRIKNIIILKVSSMPRY
ncbi:MAG: hypothetical protein KC505_02770 [Myxococcales bacterium]|nr:hypothetical protein [Myxococcales bacterium]USN49893.1 MAG: hypothetical protein H6731_06325 [Myxococcales bacterium]